MATLWLTIITLMLGVYVVLDGFDFRAGILHLLAARTDRERRTIFAAIGPVWDGNEVWLLASGGVLVFAFPRVYAAGFSGFYMPMMMALWLLILRGISIEFRSHQASPLWRSFWDGVFWFSSTLMAVILGAALGNVIRGVPIGADGFFSGPLFTDFKTGYRPGVLDWYTTLVGLFALCVLALHGALYLAWKTEDAVRERSHVLARRLWFIVFAIGIVTTGATAQVCPSLYAHLWERPWTWALSAGVIVGLVGMFVAMRRRKELAAFLFSAGFILSLLGATAAGLYPTILTSTLSPAYDLTVVNASTGTVGLRSGLIWWTIAILLAIGYFIYLFYSFRGKVSLEAEHYH